MFETDQTLMKNVKWEIEFRAMAPTILEIKKHANSEQRASRDNTGE